MRGKMKWLLIFAAYCISLYFSPRVIAHVFDLEPRNQWHEYVEDTRENEMSIAEWVELQQANEERVSDWLADGFDCALNPWYEPTYHNEKNE